jgi:amino acid permease
VESYKTWLGVGSCLHPFLTPHFLSSIPTFPHPLQKERNRQTMSITSIDKEDKLDQDLEKRDTPSSGVHVHYEEEVHDHFYKRRSFHSSKTDICAKYKRESWLIHKGVYEDDPGLAVDTGLQRKMKNRHIAMISIGGVIGTGLFLVSETYCCTTFDPYHLLLGYRRITSNRWSTWSSFRLYFHGCKTISFL